MRSKGDVKSKDFVDDTVFRDRFVHYFGGPCVEFGQLLVDRLFGGPGTINEETFISALTNLARLSAFKGNLHEAEKFFFYVFSQGKEHLDKKGLIEVIHVAGMFALVVGSELHEKAVVPRDLPVIEAFVSAAMLMADPQTQELSATQFAVWMNEHCPRLLEGINHWIETVLHGDHTHTNEPSSDPVIHTLYQLPTPKLEDGATEDQINNMYVFIWALSTIVPLVYLGHKRDESSAQSHNKHPLGGTWTLLYSSDRDGLSMNRFQSHCFDYREPSIMIITGIYSEGQENQFIIGVDREWRDGTYFWGDDDCFLMELKPSFSMLNKGAKLISLNEKQRGFPVGLRFMKDTSYKSNFLLIEPDFENAFRNEDIPFRVTRVEVWGCGGQEAAESQQRLKEWEKKEVLRRRKINREDLKEAWEESPDRFILELGGVKVNHPKEQQQE